MTLQAPASEFLAKPATWRIALEDPMALQATVMALTGVVLLLFLCTLFVIDAAPLARLLPPLLALCGLVAACIYLFLRRRRLILLAFERGFLTRAHVTKTSWFYTQRPIELLYTSGSSEVVARAWLAWGSNHRRLRRHPVAWVVIDPVEPAYAYFVEPLGVQVPTHLEALDPTPGP